MIAAPAQQPNGRHVRQALLGLVLALAVGFGLYQLIHNLLSHPPLVFTAFVSAPTALHTKDPISLESENVGTIQAFGVVEPVVTFTIQRSHAALDPVQQVTIVAGSGPHALSANLVINVGSYGPRTSLEINDGVQVIPLTYSRPGHWWLWASTPGVVVNGVTRIVKPGDSLDVPASSAFTTGSYVLHLGDMRLATPTQVAIDTHAVRRLLESTGRLQSNSDGLLKSFGPGASLQVGSGLGLTRTGIQLKLAAGGPVEPWLARTTQELAVEESNNIEATLTSFVAYLGSPSAMHQEPTDRFEQAVYDLNQTLAGLSSTARNATELVSGLRDKSKLDGWILDATLGAPARTDLDRAVAHLTGEISGGPLKAVLGVDTALSRIDSSVAALTGSIGKDVHRLSLKADSTLHNAARETNSINDSSLVDHVKHTLDSLTPKVSKSATDAITNAGQGIVKPVTIGVYAAIMWFAASILHTLHLIH